MTSLTNLKHVASKVIEIRPPKLHPYTGGAAGNRGILDILKTGNLTALIEEQPDTTFALGMIILTCALILFIVKRVQKKEKKKEEKEEEEQYSIQEERR